EQFCILGADGEAQQVARVAEDGGSYLLRHLGDVLVSQCQVEPVLARLGENLDEARGGEVLELVDVEEEVAPLGFRKVSTVHGGQLQPGNQHGAQERRVVLTQLALRDVDQQDLSPVHNPLDVNRAPAGVGYPPHQGRRDELTDFVENRRNRLSALAL